MTIPPSYPPVPGSAPGSPPGSGPPEPSDSKRDKRIRLVEDVFTLICIVSLWPVVLGWQGLLYQAILYTALAGLVLIFYRRMSRFRKVKQKAESGPGNGA